MNFLDLNGLTHFFGKVKTWASNNYLSLKGGTINGNVNISGNVSATQVKKTNGTSTQVLIADGSVKGINSANGIAGLDANGYVPLAQLGNLDTTVAEVVTTLPTTNIKKHIYLIKDTNGVTKDKYEEYIYTGDTSATYDASKWEKLGDFRATVDLTNYYTKSQVDSIANGKSSTSHTHSVIINGITKTIAASGGVAVNLGTYLTSHQSLADYAKKNEAVGVNGIQLEKTAQGGTTRQNITFSNINKGNATSVTFEDATTNMSGFMPAADKNKLNKFDMSNISDNIDVSLLVTAEFNDVEISGEGNYLVVSLATLGGNDRLAIQLPLATSNANGIMSASNKVKLDGIASGATADSAISTAQIDTLFV